MARDDFSKTTIATIARRSGYRCSFPGCKTVTSGPHTDPHSWVNIGVAAHIAAASVGGPRYNESMSPADRKSPENGIWLCQNHAKLVDNDELRFTAEVLLEWKQRAEGTVRAEIESFQTVEEVDVDIPHFFIDVSKQGTITTDSSKLAAFVTDMILSFEEGREVHSKLRVRLEQLSELRASLENLPLDAPHAQRLEYGRRIRELTGLERLQERVIILFALAGAQVYFNHNYGADPEKICEHMPTACAKLLEISGFLDFDHSHAGYDLDIFDRSGTSLRMYLSESQFRRILDVLPTIEPPLDILLVPNSCSCLPRDIRLNIAFPSIVVAIAWFYKLELSVNEAVARCNYDLWYFGLA